MPQDTPCPRQHIPHVSQHHTYLFSMGPLAGREGQCHYGDKVEVNFAPVRLMPGVEQDILPVYNLDRRFETKAFIVQFRKDYYLSRPSKEKLKFSRKFREKTFYLNCESMSELEGAELGEPSHKHCYVCSQDYSDYNQHLAQQQHSQGTRASPASQYILELVSKYAELRPSRGKRRRGGQKKAIQFIFQTPVKKRRPVL